MPYIGNPIAMVVTFLFSFITMDSLLFPILIQVGLFVTNFIQDTVVVGGYIWGFPEMLLFIPLVGILRIFLERSEDSQPFAVFFAELTDKDKKRRARKVFKLKRRNNKHSVCLLQNISGYD